MSKLEEIKDGYGNLFKKNEEVEKLAEQRLKECNPCDSNSNNKNSFGRLLPYCTECGCVISAKVRSPESKCPLGKW